MPKMPTRIFSVEGKEEIMATGFESYPKLYGSTRWRRVAKLHLDSFPLCNPCLLSNKETAATIVHHRIPHHGNPELFWDGDNLESVCSSCHSGIKRMEENYGYDQSCDASGIPLSLNHPWNVKR